MDPKDNSWQLSSPIEFTNTELLTLHGAILLLFHTSIDRNYSSSEYYRIILSKIEKHLLTHGLITIRDISLIRQPLHNSEE